MMNGCACDLTDVVHEQQQHWQALSAKAQVPWLRWAPGDAEWPLGELDRMATARHRSWSGVSDIAPARPKMSERCPGRSRPGD